MFLHFIRHTLSPVTKPFVSLAIETRVLTSTQSRIRNMTSTTPQVKPEFYPAETKQPQTVCVTGATGYLGSNLVYRLLAAGHTVHGTVRSPAKAGDLKTFPGATERLKIFQADLLQPDGFKTAMQGCTVVFHTASPFTNKGGYGPAAMKSLVTPAVQGTENVLNAVNEVPSVKRVVLTSSTSAIVHSYRDKATGFHQTEEDWNTRSSVYDMPYNFSKTKAERRAWEIAEQQSRWDMVVINPSVIFGPPAMTRSDAESIEYIRGILRGDYAFACPTIGLGMVDVRDCCAAHMVAAFTPEAKGRHIVNSECLLIKDLAVMISNLYPKQVRKPQHHLPRWLAVLLASFRGSGKDWAKANVGGTAYVSNAKSVKELGMHYMPIKESITDMCMKLEEIGAIKPRK